QLERQVVRVVGARQLRRQHRVDPLDDVRREVVFDPLQQTTCYGFAAIGGHRVTCTGRCRCLRRAPRGGGSVTDKPYSGSSTTQLMPPSTMARRRASSLSTSPVGTPFASSAPHAAAIVDFAWSAPIR